MVKGLQCLTHSLTGQTNIWLFVRPMALLTHWCWTKPAQMPETQMSSLSLLHRRWNTASPKHVHLSNQAFACGYTECKWKGLCVPASISVQTGCCLMMKWCAEHQTEGGTSAPELLCSPVEPSLPQSSSQWGSAWGGKCCFFRSVSPYPLIPSHDWQSWFRVYGVPF